MNNLNNNNFTFKSGVHLFVHNQSEVHHTFDTGINISPGFETYVGIKRKFINKLSKPYSNCLTDLTNPSNGYAKLLYDYFNEVNVTYYDQDFCYTLCYQDKLIDACSCGDIIAPSLRHASFCAKESEIACLRKFNAYFTMSDINSLCQNACPEQCNKIEYDFHLSTSSFPTSNYLKLLQTSSSYENFFPQNVSDLELSSFARQGFLKVIVNYDDLYFTAINDNPAMDSNSLFGFLGGQLGVY